MSNENKLSTAPAGAVAQKTAGGGALSVFADGASFNTALRMAQCLASSTVVPKEYHGNVGNCMIAIGAYEVLRARNPNYPRPLLVHDRAERGVGYSIDERDVKVYNGWRRNRRKRGIDPDWPTPTRSARSTGSRRSATKRTASRCMA